MVRRLARFRPDAAAAAELEKLRAEDGSDRGRRSAMASEALRPDPAAKRRWLDVVSAPDPTLPLPDARAVMSALFPLEQWELGRPFDDQIFAYLSAHANAGHEEYLSSYAAYLTPLRCEAEASARVRRFVETTKFPLLVKRAMLVRLQEDERCQRVRRGS